MALLNSSDETNVTESEGPDGSDCSPHGKTLLSTNEASKDMNTAPSVPQPEVVSQQPTGATSPNPVELSLSTVPLPPPETGAYDKQPGHTRSSLQKLTIAPLPRDRVTDTNTAPLATNNNGNKKSAPSSGSSPTATDSDWGNTPPSTVPPSRNPSQPPSRAPSMSSGAIGGKPPMAGVPKKNGNATLARDTSTASSSTVTPNHNNSQANRTQSSKAPSVHSESGASHKFNLKDLLNTGPKLPRRSSQRSTASRSSRRSDSDGGSDGGKAGGKTKSTAGESTASLSKKYGVCQKVAIGKGATSVVRLAHKWDRSEEKLYAVKEFRKRRKNESEKEYVKKLTAEFCISSTLHHINVVETVDLVQDESLHWCEVMEFCPGGDLYAAIKKGGMSPSEVECCFKQILSGVEYLHSQGVAHRDIKPENLFFDAKGHLKIGDYGASTVYRLPWEATVHMSTGLCGSEPYIAPEQFLGKPYDARLVDIWACGIVYYCLHFQELPWRSAQPSQDSLYAAYAAACANPSPAVSACPPTINNLSPRACRSIIRRMLEPDPRHRATIEEVIAHPWVKSIEVCYEVKEPKHVHVSARAMAAHLIPVS